MRSLPFELSTALTCVETLFSGHFSKGTAWPDPDAPDADNGTSGASQSEVASYDGELAAFAAGADGAEVARVLDDGTVPRFG